MILNKDNATIKSIGRDVQIGERVEFKGFKDKHLFLYIGDNVKIENDVRIVVGGFVIISNDVTLHNHVTIHGPGNCTIGDRTWVGQQSALDATGDLEIGADCCIGFNCQIWSHVGRVPKLPNIRFEGKKKTVLKNRVWLQGGLITVNPGVILEEDCVILSNSVVNHNTLPNKVYGGVPAKIIEKFNSPYITE